MRRHRVVLGILLFCSVSTFAQDRSGWRTARDIGEGARGSVAGTVIDIDASRNRLQIETDEGSSRVTVEADAVATEYQGFGTVIAGRPEIFTGSSGFSNIRLEDRIEVRGAGRGSGVVVATYITLLGRRVPASSVGVGGTRSPSSASTPTMPSVAATAIAAPSMEGTIRQINLDEGRLVIQTPDRRMITVRAARSTPVIYQGEEFRLANLEIGDRVRVTADRRNPTADEVTAERIEVVQGVAQGSAAPTTGGTFMTLEGLVSRVDTASNFAWVDTSRETVRVDMNRAEDSSGRRIGARDLVVGVRTEISGSYNRAGDIFVATTVRSGTGGSSVVVVDEFIRYGVVTIDGAISETLEEATTIGVRERATGRIVRIWLTEDFIVRLKASSTTGSNLRVADNVRVKAFRDAAGNLIAQTITVRNR
ncbi:MAG: hypothetical protein WA208_07320 [Thermoanaerobaculia bacterium]